MKAIISDKYGQPDVLKFRELQKPTLRDDAVLVTVRAASVNAYDWHLLTADVFLVRLMGGGLLKPKDRIPGADVAGLVEVAGKNVTQFRAGDEVFGDIAHGAFAEYACAAENRLALKPASLWFEAAAAVPMAALTALQGLRDAATFSRGKMSWSLPRS